MVIVLVYDVTERKSYQEVALMAEKMKSQACLGAFQRVIVVGNKVDKQKSRKVSKEEGEKFGKSMGLHL